MGLDSLPASTVSELSLSSSSLYGSNSLGSSHSHEGDDLHLMDDYYPMDYINMPLKVEKSSLVVMESKAQTVGMKRFQSEMLPPKSVKPIQVAHNELLSPVKSHVYIPPKNAAHIKVDTKINEASSSPYMTNRMSSVGSSSVPLKNIDLKEKSEAAQYASKLVDLHTANQVNGKPSEESNDLYKSTSTFKGSRDPVNNGSHHIVSKGKSVSLPTPSKGSVQTRSTSILNDERGYLKQKEQNKIKQNKLSMSQKKTTADQARVMQRRACTGNTSNVLVQNNQKQVCVSNKTSKMKSNKPTRTWSSESSTGSKKIKNNGAVNANIEPKISSTMITDAENEFPVSKRKIISENKRYISRDVQSETKGSINAANNFDSMSIKCFVTTDGSIDQDAFNMKEGKDVVSFTFTSPLRRSMPESRFSTEPLMETKSGIDVNSLDHIDKLYPKELSLSPPRLGIIDGNDLSSLLDKKLQELTSRINSPQCTLATEGSSSGLRSSLEDKFHSLVSATAKEHDRSFHPHHLSNELDNMYDNGCCSSHNSVLKICQKQQTSEPMEGPSCSSSGESGYDLGSLHSVSVTDFDNPFVKENYLDHEDSSTYGSTVYCSMQGEEVSNSSPTNEYVSLENKVKWYEKSSSTASEGNTAIKELTRKSILVDFTRSTRNMELEYVKDILTNAELMAEEFVVGHTDKIVMPNLFDVLENHSNETENYNKEYSKLERKVLFDTISECLELRCRKAFVGSCKGWPIWMASVKRKSRLAEELYKEVLGFKNVEEETVVDEHVSKDMSIGLGTWLDFDIEAFQEGLDVELDIVIYLINELVVDLLCI
ncbi:unnamed protein product [Lupinus luteus]|uniref:DUF4378 domain-containing protein n=1 Tax=Lupinus luteus TaxID=3873 RepID=A0AAV1VTB9_LUPLU